jgi:hypothetical protein
MACERHASSDGRRRDSRRRAAAHPQLVDDLRWHTAAAAAFLNNIDTFERKTSELKEQIDSLE